eukprot:NODE_8042_length_1528_cov_2.848680.p1 GENE.NODE_8042_length_1528_cov_2.848680~~NODE_8042_length_1528_cov_2.848680.p1  ORF type:complete len:435 (+),score=132.73 NODE_8042_length_1528_cov_2.848680:97-1305(+)
MALAAPAPGGAATAASMRALASTAPPPCATGAPCSNKLDDQPDVATQRSCWDHDVSWYAELELELKARDELDDDDRRRRRSFEEEAARRRDRFEEEEAEQRRAVDEARMRRRREFAAVERRLRDEFEDDAQMHRRTAEAARQQRWREREAACREREPGVCRPEGRVAVCEQPLQAESRPEDGSSAGGPRLHSRESGACEVDSRLPSAGREQPLEVDGSKQAGCAANGKAAAQTRAEEAGLWEVGGQAAGDASGIEDGEPLTDNEGEPEAKKRRCEGAASPPAKLWRPQAEDSDEMMATQWYCDATPALTASTRCMAGQAEDTCDMLSTQWYSDTAASDAKAPLTGSAGASASLALGLCDTLARQLVEYDDVPATQWYRDLTAPPASMVDLAAEDDIPATQPY